MSAHVDERIVQMQFDNAQFEERARNTISILGSLSEALNLPNGGKGLQEIQNAARQINFDRLNGAIDIINERFSTMGMIATNVFNRITNAVIDAGHKMVNAVTMEPIHQGFQEYELQMDSVKRILNSAKNDNGLPVTLDQVNKKLDELNTYADKTIYSFSDMTTNIGKFTNAGVDLDKSVLAIQGIANEAALAGANSQEASRAMYNFAQALSTGYVQRIDWKSIELANMATTGFKEALVDTAVKLNTLRKVGDKYVTTTTNMNGKTSDAMGTMQLFSDGLSYQWMTTDVLIDTLKRYSDENDELGKAAFRAATEVTTFSKLIDTLKESLGSGWTKTWQLIIGDFDEARALWTGVNDVLSGLINRSADARNKLLSDWAELGGRKAVIEGLSDAWAGVANIVRDVTRGFRRVFPALEGVDLFKISEGIKSAGKAFRQFTIREGIPFANAVEGMASVLDILGQIISAIGRTISESLAPAVGPVGDLIDELFEGAGSIGQWLSSVAAYTRENDTFYNAIQKVLDVFRGISDAIQNAKSKVEEFFGIRKKLTGKGWITGSTEIPLGTKDLNDEKVSLLERAVGVITRLGTAIKNFISSVKNSEGFKSVTEGLRDLFEALGHFGSVLGSKLAEILNSVGIAIGNLFKTAKDAKPQDMLNVLNVGFIGAIGLAINKLSKSLTGKNPFQVLIGFFKSIGNFHELIEDAGKAMTEFLEGLTEPLKQLTASLKADVLIKIATAIAILAGSAVLLAAVDPEKLSKSLIAIGGLMTELGLFMTLMDKFSGSGSNISKFGASMVAFSIAIGILALAVRALAGIDPDQLATGVLAVGVLMALMVLLGKLGGQKINSKGMIAMSVAILILQNAVKSLSEIDPDKLLNGVLAVGILMALMTLMSKLGGKSFSGAGMIAVAIAITILKNAVQEFADMDVNSLLKGIGAVGALILELTLFSAFAKRGGVGLAVSLIAMGASMRIFAEVLGTIGRMPLDNLGKGIAGIGYSLLAVVVALNFIPKGAVLKAAAIAIVAYSLGLIADVLTDLGKFDLKSMVIALAGLGVALAEIVIATNLMKGTAAGALALRAVAGALAIFVPVLSTLGNMDFTVILQGLAALALTFTMLYVAGIALGPVTPVLLGVAAAMTLFGASAVLMGVGLLAVSAGLAALSASMVARVAAIITSINMIVTGIIGLFPLIIASIVRGIVSIVGAIGDAAPVLVGALVKIGSACLDGIRELFPKLSIVLAELLLFVLTMLAQYAPVLVNALVELVIQLVDGVAAAIYDNSDRIIAAVHHLLLALLDLILAVLQEILRGIPGIGGKIDEALGDVRDSLKEDFDKNYAQELGSDFTQGFADGLNGGTDPVESAGSAVGEAGKSGLLDALSGANPEVQKIFNGDIPAGILGSTGDGEAAASSYADTITSALSEGMPDGSETGLNINEGLSNGILDNMGVSTDAASLLGEDTIQAINDASGVASPSTKTWDTGMYMDQGLANGLTDNQSLISTAISGLSSLFDTAFGALSSVFRRSGTGAASAFGQGMRGGKAVESAAASLSSRASSALSSGRGAFSQNGSVSGSLYASGLRSKAGETRTAGALIGATAVTGAGTARVAFGTAGISSGGRYASGISSKSADARRAGTQIGTSAANGAKSVGGFYEAGRDSGQGYLNGLLSKAQEIANAAARVVGNALQKAKDTIDSHSPSRAYMELGENSDEGYIIGVENKAAKVNETMERLALGAMHVFYEGISRANTLANDALYVSPKITPVLDLDNVDNRVDYLSGMFNDAGGVLGTINADVNNNIEDIREIKENMKEILSALSNRRPISIDGKTVIGWVDTELGAL